MNAENGEERNMIKLFLPYFISEGLNKNLDLKLLLQTNQYVTNF